MLISKFINILLLEHVVDCPLTTDLVFFKKKRINIIFCKKNTLSFFFTLVSVILLFYNLIKFEANQTLGDLLKHSFLEFFFIKFFFGGVAFSSKPSYLIFYPQIYIAKVSRSLYDILSE